MANGVGFDALTLDMIRVRPDGMTLPQELLAYLKRAALEVHQDLADPRSSAEITYKFKVHKMPGRGVQFTPMPVAYRGPKTVREGTVVLLANNGELLSQDQRQMELTDVPPVTLVDQTGGVR